MKHLASLVTRFPILCLVLSLCLAAPFLIQLPRIQTVDNVDYFTVEDDPDVAFYQSIKDTFGEDEFFVIAFSNPELFTPPILRMIAAITQELETIPEVREVQSLANVDYIHGEEEYFEVRPFLERIPEDAPGLAVLRKQALGNPLYVGNLVSADGETTALVVFPTAHEAGDGSFRKRLIEQTETVLAKHEALAGRFHLAGWTMTNFSLSQYMKSDVAVFIPVTYLFITLTIWLFFRNVRLTLLALANISMCTGATMGLFPLLGITLNNVTTVVPPLVMALALADSVHIFAHLDKKLLDDAPSPAKAMESILHRVITPCFLTSLTTAVGFISLVVSDIPPIKEFGYVASAGMIFEFLFSFLLLPPLMLMCRPDAIYTHQRKDIGMGAFLGRLSTLVQTHARPITIFIAFLTLGALWAASTIRVETNLLEYFKPSSPLRQELSYIEPRLSGVGTVDISVKAGERDALRDPDKLAVIDRLQTFALTLPGVDRTMSFVDFLKDMNMSFHNEDPDFYVIPVSRELVSQYLLLYDSDDMDEFITPEYDQARILIRISEHSSAGQAELIDSLRAFIDQHEHDGLQIRVTGRAVQDVNTIDALVQGQVESLALAAAVITFIMFLALRSLVTGALSLIPNAFPIILNFGIMGLLGIPLNTSTALISVVALGIAVDDTIHFLTEYNRKRAENLPMREALQQSILEKGTAITASSLILVIGFGVLLFSSFVPTMSFGGLSAVIMITALIGDLIVLPAAMLSFDGKSA
ncbi:efflux RND transporter permease subunit [Desulfomicrobium baculatum]|uniref:Patched family protein n=1 Tax=Desulfomicrobium baculatum (strain DSM 4028 / VKM B-1378 / X) TaxID=525897 RepID=C7LPT2_DESBD|nr:efflux RND transporter permease subunit [Desulfomicrobium baculatum]ACU90311.1 Patched family protein [Desulfomicrobium baculatum DSM 4028]